MKLYIKNMVCQRCVAAVRNIFQEENLKIKNIDLGEVNIEEESLTNEQMQHVNEKLRNTGFELIDNSKSRVIEKIRNVIIEKIHHSNSMLNVNWSDHITSVLPYDYKYLSQLFSSVEGVTIEHYIIKQKTEKAKELIIYDELSLSEIAYKLGYSSVPHFSSQFKKTTGMTPSGFKKLNNRGRKPLDLI